MKHYKKKLDNTSFIMLSILVIGLAINHSRVVEYVLLIIASFFIVNIVLKLRRYIKYRLSHVDTMTGLEFEKYVAKYLQKQGYKTDLTEKYDLGIDIVAVRDGIRYGVQVKRYQEVVGANAVRQAVTGLNLYDCDRAMVITNSYFSKTAIRLANSNDCILLDRDFLIK